MRCSLRKPRALHKGAGIQIVEPSSPFEREALSHGLSLLRDMGLNPLYSERIFQKMGYLAGADVLRAKELVEAFSGDDVCAIIPARGGYGAMRVLEYLEAHRHSIKPHLFMGFSDITALHMFFLVRYGLVTIHGTNAIFMAKLDRESLERTKKALFGIGWEETFLYGGLTPIVKGVARGRVVAGNLSLLCALFGTPYEPPLEGAILVIEEVDEPLYRIDRMLMQISLQRGFGGVRGVCFGDMGVVSDEQEALVSLLEQFAVKWGKPCVFGFPIGHKSRNFPVPEGVMATLDADIGVMRVLECPYEE
jgi:muramoyltetrapeptide carboxypeptidase